MEHICLDSVKHKMLTWNIKQLMVLRTRCTDSANMYNTDL
jgi:hypothetical protein